MMGSSHAVSGAAVWLNGWALAATAGVAEPRADVLTVGTLVCAGAALVPDFDHPKSRLAQSAGPLSQGFARIVGWVGARIHAATKLDADRPDIDGHRTATHTIVFAVLAGCLVSGFAGLSGDLGDWLARSTGMPIAALGRLPISLLVFAFVQLGAAAIRSNFGGRRKRVRPLGKSGPRLHKATFLAWLCAIGSYVLVPADVWWLGLAVGMGCVVHCLGDAITASGCPMLWPAPIPSYETVRVRGKGTQRVRVWRTWYLVGTPKWMRFTVGTRPETYVTWALTLLAAVSIAGLVYAGVNTTPNG